MFQSKSCIGFHLRRVARTASRVVLFSLIALGFSACTQVLPDIPGAARPSAENGGPVYLALGDSLAYGMQIGKLKRALAAGPLDPALFDTGYVDHLAADLRARDPAWRVVDLGCPGETSASFITGPCAFASSGKPFGTVPLPLHHAYSASQLGAALSILGQSRNSVRLITFDLGINDLRAVEAGCPDPAHAPDRYNACMQAHWPDALAQIQQRLERILGALRQAAPNATLLVLTYYDWQGDAHGSSAPVRDLDRAIITAAARVDARTVDTFVVFNGDGSMEEANGKANDKTNNTAAENRRLCNLTLYCTGSHDLHPSDAGYALIGEHLIAALPPSL